jgi:uncharacterized SAM-binding protein YcdF (DUF218 family)
MTGLVLFPRRIGRRLAAAGALSFVLLSVPLMDWLLALPLISKYPVRPFQPSPGIQAIVVLGSSSQPPEYERPYALPDQETYSRCEHAAWIFRKWGPLPVLAGQGGWSGRTPMQDLLQRAGIPENLIWVENRSRSTHENAVFAGGVLRQHGIKRIVLVVDVQSMPRAAACFRREGLEVLAAPSEFRTLGSWSEELLPGWEAIRRNETTLHEVLGLAWYRVRGWI